MTRRRHGPSDEGAVAPALGQPSPPASTACEHRTCTRTKYFVDAPFDTSLAMSSPSVASEPTFSASRFSACLSTVPPLQPTRANTRRPRAALAISFAEEARVDCPSCTRGQRFPLDHVMNPPGSVGEQRPRYTDPSSQSARSSGDRALPCGGRGRKFESCRAHTRAKARAKAGPRTRAMMLSRGVLVEGTLISEVGQSPPSRRSSS